MHTYEKREATATDPPTKSPGDSRRNFWYLAARRVPGYISSSPRIRHLQ